MRLAITGGSGFLGWHTACRLRALHGVAPLRLDRVAFSDPQLLADAMKDVDAVLHVAGVNRGRTDDDVEQGNVTIARTLASAVRLHGRPIDLVYANSIHADRDEPYGRGKAAAADILDRAVSSVGGRFMDLLLPNLFGEHGRPGYNSFVATFAHELAAGRQPVVTADRQIPLLHVQDAAHEMIESIGAQGRRPVVGEPHGIGEVLDTLERIHRLYGGDGQIPPLTGRFELNVFNTYRAAAFPTMWPMSPPVHADDRGALFETVRVHGGTGQVFVSTTRPGQVRGNHYHLHKIERFFVVRGEAEIRLRRLLQDEVVTFRLSGDTPSFVDMPTLWAHSIRNVGDTDLVTLFWADQLLDPAHPDQYPEEVVAP